MDHAPDDGADGGADLLRIETQCPEFPVQLHLQQRRECNRLATDAAAVHQLQGIEIDTAHIAAIRLILRKVFRRRRPGLSARLALLRAQKQIRSGVLVQQGGRNMLCLAFHLRWQSQQQIVLTENDLLDPLG